MIKLTIGITFFNRLNELKKNIENLYGEIKEGVELIIVNDNINIKLNHKILGITDFENIIIINNNDNIGEYENFLKLLSLSRGEYFTWLADDDYYESGLIESILLKIKSNNYDVVFTRYKLKYNSKIVSNFNSLNHPHKEILNGNIKSVSLYCIYKSEFLKKITLGIPPFCSAKIALYFEYALLLN
jgi:glycosyltransferase involved in cell wall biosynthesis